MPHSVICNHRLLAWFENDSKMIATNSYLIAQFVARVGELVQFFVAVPASGLRTLAGTTTL